MPDNSQTADSLETPSGADAASVKDRPVLLASVIVMGVLLIIGFVVVFGTIIYRVMNSPEAAPVAVRGQFGTVDVRVPDGTTLLGTTLIEDRLSIVTSSQGIAEVILIDTKRGVELGRVRLVSDGSAADAARGIAPPQAD
ncbi:MAG: hypothetical protein RLO08_04210 [Parvibaculaceae bacterium]